MCDTAGLRRYNGSIRFQEFSFGSIRIDGTTYEHAVVIDHGAVRKRKKKPSKTVPLPIGAHASL
jgi:hypothetical protein